MRLLVTLLALFALLFFCSCTSGTGPSSVLDIQPGIGGGARVFATPDDGFGCAGRVDLGRYGLRTGKAAEPVPASTADAPRVEGAPTAAPPAEAIDAASVVPAGLLGLPDRGRIARGARADLVLLDTALRAQQTIVGGVMAWRS